MKPRRIKIKRRPLRVITPRLRRTLKIPRKKISRIQESNMRRKLKKKYQRLEEGIIGVYRSKRIHKQNVLKTLQRLKESKEKREKEKTKAKLTGEKQK